MESTDRNILYSWCYYAMGKTPYIKCMEKAFAGNLISLRQLNIVVFLIASAFSLFPAVIEDNLFKSGVYWLTAMLALALYFPAKHKYGQVQIFARRRDEKGKALSRRYVYLLITLSYANIMLFGVYVGVWSGRDKPAVIFMCFLIVALLLFIVSPRFHLSLSTGALILFLVSSVLLKESRIWIFDVINALTAYLMSLIFNWRTNRYRLSAILSSGELEEERNIYLRQSNVDELTQLNNRRSFNQTFQRYLTNYRDTDKWLCLAMLDIDFFKKYNDHYGHPQGDAVLRTIGGLLNSLKGGKGVFPARIGGEEFAVLWFEEEQNDVRGMISHLLEKVEALEIPHAESEVSGRVTISIGVYMVRLPSLSDTAQDIYHFADAALYEAKNSGRNRAVIRDDAGNGGGISLCK